MEGAPIPNPDPAEPQLLDIAFVGTIMDEQVVMRGTTIFASDYGLLQEDHGEQRTTKDPRISDLVFAYNMRDLLVGTLNNKGYPIGLLKAQVNVEWVYNG